MEILYINIGHIIAKIGRLFRLQIHRIVDNIASKTSIYSTLSHNNILYIEVFFAFQRTFCNHFARISCLSWTKSYNTHEICAIEYSLAMKSHYLKLRNQSSSTRESPILCLITYLFLLTELYNRQ